MKRATLAFLFTFGIFSLIVPNGSFADEQQEKWPDEKKAGVTKTAVADASEKYGQATTTAPTAKKERKWRIFGKTGYRYDDNVRLQSNKPYPRKVGRDQDAGRYTLESGLAYNVFKNDKYKIDLSYKYAVNWHDDSLNEFNFQDHRIAVTGRRYFKFLDRPSEVNVRYHYEHGILHADSHSSTNAVSFSWLWQWADNWKLSVYERFAFKNFRDKGFNPDDTSRDGFYNRTGFLQRYFFEAFERKSEINAGYEIGVVAAEGNRFDQISNGVRVGFETRLIEKISFETNFYFQNRYFNHFPGDPDRHDLHWKHEYFLKRPIGNNLELRAFYKRFDVNALHDGVHARYNYNRNIYGFELRFSY